LPLETLDEARLRVSLAFALRALGQEPARGTPREMLAEAARRFDPRAIPRSLKPAESSADRGSSVSAAWSS
jgi:hypothetical protein